MKSPIILAIDTKDLDLAGKWIAVASEYVDHFKVGLEFYLRHGSADADHQPSESNDHLVAFVAFRTPFSSR